MEYLQDLRIDEDATVAGALEAVMEAMEDEREAKEVVGKAHAVVLYSPDMHWGDFVATLARIGTARRVWLREVSTPEQIAERDDALSRVRNAEIVLPSWANSAAFWTPEMCAATRFTQDAVRLVPSATAREKRRAIDETHRLQRRTVPQVVNDVAQPQLGQPAARIGGR